MKEKTILKEVAKRFFLNNPVKIAQHFEGQGLTANNTYKLGVLCAGEFDIESLFHEMAHLAERPLKVILKKPHISWGFSFGKAWEIATPKGFKSGFETYTDQSVLCEARVWSYQLSLQRELGINTTAEELVSSAKYLPAFCYFERKVLDNQERGYREKEEYALIKMAELVENDTKKYTYLKFLNEWNLRMEKLKL